MPNILKEIFSDKPFDFGGKIEFHSNEAYKKFLEKLQIVQDERTSVEEALITTALKDNKIQYPFLVENNITGLIITLSKRDIPIILDTKYGQKNLLFQFYKTTNESVLENDEHEIVYFRFIFPKYKLNYCIFIYRLQPQFAKTVKDIIESYNTAIVFLDKLFNYNNEDLSQEEYALIYETKKTFLTSKALFEKLYLIEQEFKLSFNPIKINNTEVDEEVLDEQIIEELYLLLIEKKVIRLNSKLSNPKSRGLEILSKDQKIEIGKKIEFTFISNSKYTILNETISIYTANLLSNAIIREIQEEKDGGRKILYGEMDSQPMYISYSAFKTIDEAQQEKNHIMEHIETYKNALTVEQYIELSNKI